MKAIVSMRMAAAVFVMALAGGVQTAGAQALGYAIAGPAGQYGFFGTSGLAGHGAAGGEVLIQNRVGLGGEYGIFAGEGGGMYVGSLNGVVHFAPAERQRGTRPFLTGGYTRLSSGDGDFNAWNVGAGVDIWARERVGVRVELRDHIRPDDRGDIHYWAIRAGVVIR